MNDSGNIATIDSNELPKEDEEFVNEYRTDRFEFSFLKIPFDMQVGTVVRDIPTGEYYVLAQGKEEWNKYIKRIDEQKLYVDFSDVQVVAYRLTERGYWSHDHINPLYIEPETLEHKPDSKKHNALKHALESLGTYLKDQSCGKPVSGEAVIAYSLEYAERCLNREERLEFVLRATAVENILW